MDLEEVQELPPPLTPPGPVPVDEAAPRLALGTQPAAGGGGRPSMRTSYVALAPEDEDAPPDGPAFLADIWCPKGVGLGGDADQHAIARPPPGATMDRTEEVKSCGIGCICPAVMGGCCAEYCW
mmetsp:Transcript_86522/g.242284  ORF Transcript_86522/g.242284 Transcript_86522/m.242284 type:complete len:124 (+) Transcript_86522:1346-1717(+)